jgi:alpha-D-xyloside xylohydrolase
MRKTTVFLMAAAILAFAACSPGVKKTAHGVKVAAGDGTTVRVEVVTDDIIHVEAVPQGAKFSKKESLIIVPQEYKTKYEIEKTADAVAIRTASLTVTVNKADGRVQYADAQGNPLTKEIAREFTPIEVDGDKSWTVHQTFDSPDDEAFYGLGQHQADEWNYKGKNEELYQYNTKISVPFIVSSKNYGILWDSYSFLRWGDPRDYAHLGEVFTLYDKDGVEGALTGTYVPMQMRAWPTRPGMPARPQPQTLVRRETAINQEYLITPECQRVENAPNFMFAGSNVTFEGEIEPKESGTYRFLLYYAGYTKVYVNDELVVPEIWRTAWNPNSHKFAVDLEQGKRVPIRIEWQPDGGTSYCGLRVLSPVDEKIQGQMSWWGEMQDEIDYYFVKGDNIDKVISGYRTLTGKAQIMPKWAMGYWQSRERYSTQFELVETLREFRERGIPVDNIVQDWQYWDDDKWGSHEFNVDRYPRPKEMVDSVHAMGGRFMISVWPKFYVNTEHFKEFDEKGWMYRVPVDSNVIDWLGHEQSFYDAYAEGARKLFWQQMYDHLYPIGVDAWWMDASEPNIHDCTDMDFRKAMQGPTALGSSTEYFNAYALMNAEAIYDGQRGVDNDTRVFLLTRNGFAGLQRYSTASWSGDIGTRWEDMKTQITAGLNYSLSGIPFWGQDIGGFSVENRYSNAQRLFDRTGEENDDLKEWRELNVRWHQWGVFCPLYRAHGQFPYREPWNIAPEGHPAYENIVAQDRLRYRLMPYIYTLDARVWFDDYTLMRGLVMDFTDDSVARNIDDEFMFGDAFLVCPVYEYKARTREVYLPKGGWYDFNTGRYLEGGESFIADAPYESSPVYVRAGSIVPMGPAIEYTAQEQDGSLYIQVYGGKDGSFTLYEDDGLTYAYEKGAYANIPMKWDDASRTLTIGAREGSFDGMKAKRTIHAVLHSPEGTQDIDVHVEYDGTETTIKL